MHKCLHCSQSPTWSSRSRVLLHRFLHSEGIARREARDSYNARCKLLSLPLSLPVRILYISESNWVKSAKILPSSVAAAGRSGSRSRPPTSPPPVATHHTMNSLDSEGHVVSSERASGYQMPDYSGIWRDLLARSLTLFNRRHVNEQECAHRTRACRFLNFPPRPSGPGAARKKLKAVSLASRRRCRNFRRLMIA